MAEVALLRECSGDFGTDWAAEIIGSSNRMKEK